MSLEPHQTSAPEARPPTAVASASNVILGLGALGVGATRLALRPGVMAARAVVRSRVGAPAREALSALDSRGRRTRAALERGADDEVRRALASPPFSQAVDRLLESEPLWRLVDRIANSPEVLNAITATSASLAEEITEQARRRTIVADDAAERIARRLLGRPRHP